MYHLISKRDTLTNRRWFLRMAGTIAAGLACQPNLLRAAYPETAGDSGPDSLPSGRKAKQAPFVQIGVLLGTFARGTLEERLEAMKSCGLDYVQVSFDCAGLDAMPDEIPPELAQRIRKATVTRAITIASVQGTFNMSHPDAEKRRAGLRQLRVIAEACPPLGTSVIHLCTGTRDRDNLWRRHPDNDSPDAWRDMTECLRAAADIGRQTGVVMAFEPEVNNVVDSARKARRLLDDIGSPHLKVTIDPANVFHAGELPRMKEILDETFSLLGKDIVLAHAKDLDHDGDAGHKAAGQGKLDYDRYLALLRDCGFRGPLLLHGLSEAQVPGCVAFLRDTMARLAVVPPKTAR
jgi:sugar phosphate isomerase/epimerase